MSGGGPECPYCGHEHDYPDDWPSGEDDLVQVECRCGKMFTYSVSWSPDYTVRKAPCLNDGDHELGECITFGHAGGPHKYHQCLNCGENFYPPSHPESPEAREAARRALQGGKGGEA